MYIAIILLGITGAIAALILFILSKRFEVQEDARIAQVIDVLPGVNCGGCGYPGCSGFAGACVRAESLEELSCPVGGGEVMKKIAAIMGKDAGVSTPKIAVILCNGVCDVRPRTSQYDGAANCAIATALYAGETGCSFGCLGLGDCVRACTFDAIHINTETGIAEVSEDKCTACGACVKACPKNIIEIRPKGFKSRRIYVACSNRDKGAVARKACKNACIGCSKCMKECAFDAITVTGNLAYIDSTKCRLCRKCAGVCPTGCIHEVNFPPRKTGDEASPANNEAQPATETITDTHK